MRQVGREGSHSSVMVEVTVSGQGDATPDTLFVLDNSPSLVVLTLMVIKPL